MSRQTIHNWLEINKHQVRSAYNTQRRMPVPGRTNIVTCDGSGRVVDFEIQEGKGDLRAHIVALGKKWAGEVSRQPVMVFDREGSGSEFFAGLVKEGIRFVTWEKHADADKLAALEESRFITEFIFNGKEYGVFEGEKTFTFRPKEGESQKDNVNVKRIYVWNKTSKRRASELGACPRVSFDQTLRIFHKIMLAGKRRLRYYVYGCAYFVETSRF